MLHLKTVYSLKFQSTYLPECINSINSKNVWEQCIGWVLYCSDKDDRFRNIL